MTRRLRVCALLVSALVRVGAAGVAWQATTFPLRGKNLTHHVYRPAGPPKGTIIMGSGDVGWVGLGVSLAEFLSAEGYIVVGRQRAAIPLDVHGRQDAPGGHRSAGRLPGDLDLAPVRRTARRAGDRFGRVRRRGARRARCGVAGEPRVDEAARSPWACRPSAELAWKWTDFTSWITKGDVREPSFAPRDYIAAVSPLPLVMLQSKKDEYVTEADYLQLDARGETAEEARAHRREQPSLHGSPAAAPGGVSLGDRVDPRPDTLTLLCRCARDPHRHADDVFDLDAIARLEAAVPATASGPTRATCTCPSGSSTSVKKISHEIWP